MQGADAIAIIEEQTRFLILADHELCEAVDAPADQEAYDSHLNIEQRNKVGLALRGLVPDCAVATA